MSGAPNRAIETGGKIRIGISGWRYKGWRGSFYPEGLAQRKELEFASRRLNTIELNGSFYSLQRPDNYRQWYDETPDGFVFSIKGSGFVTHQRRLREIEMPLANFLAQGLLRLDEKLGPILWQFPPNFNYDAERFENFFALLPKTLRAAAGMARMHDDWMKDRSWLEVARDGELRHCVEFRNQSFVHEEFIAQLRNHGVGLVVADTVEWPLLMDVTADFVYCRLHGSEQLYASGYDEKAIRQWAERVVTWSRGGEVEDGKKASATPAAKRASRDVYVYFDNDAKVRAPFDAQSLHAEVDKLLSTAGRQPAV